MEIKDVMTPSPHTIGIEQTISKAEEMMNEFHIRHLPVLHGGKPVGVISSRDILLIKAYPELNPEETTLEEACSADPYMVAPAEKLSTVCQQMSENKYGCTLIVENEKVVGIFSWVDALKVLSKKL